MTDRERAFELLRKGHELDNENKAIIIDALGGMPKRTGHWKRVSADKYVQHAMAFYRCSECGGDIIGEHNYCPNCGADMRGDEE